MQIWATPETEVEGKGLGDVSISFIQSESVFIFHRE